MRGAMSTTEVVLLLGLGVSLVGHLVTWFGKRSEVKVTSISAEAAAELARAQAHSEIIDDLRRHVEALRTEVSELRGLLDRWQEVIRTLPTEQQALFRRTSTRPKATSGGESQPT